MARIINLELSQLMQFARLTWNLSRAADRVRFANRLRKVAFDLRTCVLRMLKLTRIRDDLNKEYIPVLVFTKIPDRPV